MAEHAEVGMVALRFGRDRGALPPLGPLLLGGALDRRGIAWTLADTQRSPALGPFSLDAFVALLRGLDAPIWGLSVFNDALPLVIAALPRAAAGRRVFVGGPGTLGLAEALLA
ncbi:MAG TPA: hypothetical protein VHW23_30640, partial [Kofleriaceae bacterium]|nr:hypothetical protein [Kofleriaceae bacterium]